MANEQPSDVQDSTNASLPANPETIDDSTPAQADTVKVDFPRGRLIRFTLKTEQDKHRVLLVLFLLLLLKDAPALPSS